jgi:hypothetical protein
MAARNLRIIVGGLQDQFLQQRNKVQMFGGGFGNGKTTAVVAKTLLIAKDYPGCNILIARATLPKLNDTIRKEMRYWIPEAWIERAPMPEKDSTTWLLKNGTTINFRYIAQQGKSTEQSSSNLLSATYDLIVIDQIEDPEIIYKDFLDLFGRLRGQTAYIGDDASMPATGPRWLFITANPTGNWVYTKLVRPLHQYKQHGIIADNLLYDPETSKPLLSLVEGPTHSNSDNLPADFIKGLEISYKGQMRQRFLMGKWGGYEGLVYPAYDSTIHLIQHANMLYYLKQLQENGFKIDWLEGYDHGLAVQACYLLAFIDPQGAICVIDGIYEKEWVIAKISREITSLRRKYIGVWDERIWADPAIFRRGAGSKDIVGKTTAEIFAECNIAMRRGNNDITSGVQKVSEYLEVHEGVVNPFTGAERAPMIYFSTNVGFVEDEITQYSWKKDPVTQEPIDVPVGRNDHAVDTIKYMLSSRPKPSELLPHANKEPPAYMTWHEMQEQKRYASRFRSVNYG